MKCRRRKEEILLCAFYGWTVFFSRLRLKLLQLIGSLAPVFELFVERFSLKLLADQFRSVSLHLNTSEGTTFVVAS